MVPQLKLTIFAAYPCELDQMVDHPLTFLLSGLCRHTLQAEQYMTAFLPPENTDKHY